jgi:hypothetical protein
LIPKSLPVPFKPEDVAILNQLDSNQEIGQGKILKIPGSR